MSVRLVFLGPPGAGKGTQAQLLASQYGVEQLATGDILRRNVREGTELGREAKRYMDAGDLVPDAVIIGMVESELAGSTGFIVDGFPRTIAQAQAFDALLARLEAPLTAVLLFEVPREQLIERLTGRWICPKDQSSYHLTFNPPRNAGKCDVCGTGLVQRSDDTLETVTRRMAVYDEQTAPLIAYYRKQGNLISIHAERPVVDVTAEILTALSERQGAGA
ncbi:adenylate kinase [bacterium]|nr:MAG: adenylate kinase [bacterium]